MTTTWKIADLRRKPDTGLVFEVTYIINFNLEGEGDRHVGGIDLQGDANDPNFVPFEELTEEVVIGWVQSELGEAEIANITSNIQTRLQQRIDQKNNPEFLRGTPWS